MRLGALLLAASLCAATACAARPAGSPKGWPGREWIIDGKTGLPSTFEAMLDDLAVADVVFAGEDHDNPHHHEAQRRIAEALLARKPDLAIGMEMLQVPQQKAADRWIAGEIDLDTFASETQWKRTWGFPLSLYRPIFELARTKKAPIFALNAAGDTVRKLRNVGLEGMSAEERASLPELDLENAAHKLFVKKAFGAHHDLPEDRFMRFYMVQVLWDENMAARTVDAMRSRPGSAEIDPEAAATRPVLVIAGTGHLVQRLGIPSRVERRVPQAKTRVVLAMSATRKRRPPIANAVAEKEGDWLWVTPPSH